MMQRQWSHCYLVFVAVIVVVVTRADRPSLYRTPLHCFKCNHHDKPQDMKEAACMKKFDQTKYTQEECHSENGPGKCLKAYEKTEARTRKQIEDDERSVTTRKCVSQGELEYLKTIRSIDTRDGCHTIRSTKTKHKVYCFCSNNLCNHSTSILTSMPVILIILLLIFSTINIL